MPERIDIRRFVPREQVGNYQDAFRDHLERYWFAADMIRAQLHENAQVLDVPCGTGYGASILSQAYPEQWVEVTGIDIDEDTIIAASTLFTGAGTTVVFATGDMRDLTPHRWDAVVSFEGIEHVEESEVAVGEMYRALKPGGLLIASIPKESGTNEWHKRCFPTIASIRDLFTPVFGMNFAVGTQLDGTRHKGEIFASIDHDHLTHIDECAYWIILARKE